MNHLYKMRFAGLKAPEWGCIEPVRKKGVCADENDHLRLSFTVTAYYRCPYSFAIFS
jgi:hypothetical protein